MCINNIFLLCCCAGETARKASISSWDFPSANAASTVGYGDGETADFGSIDAPAPMALLSVVCPGRVVALSRRSNINWKCGFGGFALQQSERERPLFE
jgi:hypothetical protein